MIGDFLIITSTILYTNNIFSPIWWMIISDLGTYTSGSIAIVSIYFIFIYFMKQIIQVVNQEKLEIKEND